MQRKHRIVANLMLLSAPVAAANAAWSQPTNNTGAPGDLEGVLTNVINWILGFIALVAVLMIIFGGVQYLTSAGNADTAKKGKDTITRAVMGLVIAGLAYAIVNLVIGQIKSNGSTATVVNSIMNIF